MMHISLFSGIGGFDLASEWMGWKNIASCEINEFGRRVLEHYWPDAYHHDDIHTFTYERLNDELTKRYGNDWRTDDIILTGGFPCQPYSAAGKRQGKEDDRHLWPEMLRVIREVRPKWVVGENVLGLVNWNGGLVFDEVQADLEAEGYQVQPYVLPACAINLPHRRDRVWFVAYATGKGLEVFSKRHGITNTNGGKWNASDTLDAYPSVGRLYGSRKYKNILRKNGIPIKLVGTTFSKWRNEGIKAMGNAIVPQVAYQIFKAIQIYESSNTP